MDGPRSWLRLRGLALVALVVVLGMPATGALAEAAPSSDAASASSPASVTAEVEAKADAGDVKVIAITDRPGVEVAPVVQDEVPAESVSDLRAGSAPQVALTVDADGLDALRAVPGVQRVVEDKPNRLVADGWNTAIGQPEARAVGADGAGSTLALLDVGVQADHPYLAGAVTGQACFSHSSADGSLSSLCPNGSSQQIGPGAATPCTFATECGHGTHVAGIAVGRPVTSPGEYSGVAPAASVIAVQVFSKSTSPSLCGSVSACLVAYDSDIDAALDWLIHLKQVGDPLAAGLSAVNLSLGGGMFSSACDSATATTGYVNTLRSLGVATVAASGNSGRNGTLGKAPSMTSPACVSTVVSVGASTSSGPVALASYSNLTAGTTLLAPGSGIVSSLTGSTFGSVTGTSMATPMVTAAFALLRQRAPSATVTARIATLTGSGDRVATPVGAIPQVRVDLAVGTVVPGLAPGSPFGSLDEVGTRVRGIDVRGWAIDPDTAGAVLVRVTVDGTPTDVTATGARPDVAGAFAGYGPRHGYTASLDAPAGTHQVCATAVGVGVGAAAVPLGCRTVSVSDGSPFGSLDMVSSTYGSVSVRGWTIDPDTTAPIQVIVYVDASAVVLRADQDRPDVGAAFPGRGSAHGYSATLGAAPGSHTICAYGLNVGAGSAGTLGCRSVVVPAPSPFGSLDGLRRNFDGTISVHGWAIDPDTADPIVVDVYMAGPGFPLTRWTTPADQGRPDVGLAFPASGSNHGYARVLPATPAGAIVCTVARNVGDGSDTTLGCGSLP